MKAEHLNPIGKTDYISLQHMERYRFALSQVNPGQSVLDVASGSGYGAAMLIRKGCKVIGVDFDRRVLSSARRCWNHQVFAAGDALDLPFERNSFDAVVSFETIEHVHNGDRFLSEINRVLSSSGMLICSTPNVRYTGHPTYHRKEYEAGEFFKLVQQRFSTVAFFGQYIKPWDRLKDVLWWRVGGLIVDVLEDVGYKESIKRFLAQISSVFGSGYEQECQSQAFLEQSDSAPGDGKHSVRPYAGSRLLRIMLVVARKADHLRR